MAKYSFEFKQKVVQEYLNGKGSYEYISKQSNMPDKKQVRIWVNAYKELGKEGLMRSRKNKNYYLTNLAQRGNIALQVRETSLTYTSPGCSWKCPGRIWNRRGNCGAH